MIKLKGENIIATFGKDDMTIACAVVPEGGIMLLCDAPVRNESETQNVIENHERIRFTFPTIGSLTQLVDQLVKLIALMDGAKHPIEATYGLSPEDSGMKLMGD